MEGTIFDIAEGSIHDGPGMRITVFLKGCPLRCRWCHSPEGQSASPQILHWDDMPDRVCGCKWSSEDLSSYLNSLIPLLSEGGVTFSGGEPLMQADFLNDVLNRLNPVHTLLDTCGFSDGGIFLNTARKVSLVFFGIKLLSEPDSVYWTGQSCQPAIRNLLLLDRETDVPYRLRIPLLHGITDTDNHLKSLEKLCRQLDRLSGIDFLPSNADAGAKYASCGRIFDPGFEVNAQGVIPDWFAPGTVFRQLSSNEIE